LNRTGLAHAARLAPDQGDFVLDDRDDIIRARLDRTLLVRPAQPSWK
jgi:hypothetical protein